jgi:thiamine-monophosphate kinase
VSDNIALGPGREFDVIRDLVRRWGAAARGIGDDAAVLDVPVGARLVASTDATVENVHFRRGWLSPAEIGFRAATAALSDLAAMAATPLAMLVAMSVPRDWHAVVGEIGDGLGEAARAFAAPITGGNLTGGSQLAITVTVLGSAERVLRRDGATAGDSLYVTGALGGPGAALDAWERGGTPRDDHRARFARPTARIREATWLAAHGARAAIDVSDGLFADARHLASASGVTACIELDAIPRVAGVSADDALRSGEEYELLVAAPRLDEHAFARAFEFPLTRVGSVEPVVDGVPGARVRSHGAFVDLPPGHDHFSR